MSNQELIGLAKKIQRFLRWCGESGVGIILMLVGNLIFILSAASEIFGSATWKIATLTVVVTVAVAIEFILARRSNGSDAIQLKVAKIAFAKIRSASSSSEENDAKEVAISLTYLRFVKNRNYAIKAALVGSAILLSLLSIKFPEWGLLRLSAINVLVFSLFVLKEFILEYRVRNGFYGSNRYEAQKLIDFILKNAEDIDFTDGNGKIRRALIPESSPRPEGFRGVFEGEVAP